MFASSKTYIGSSYNSRSLTNLANRRDDEVMSTRLPPMWPGFDSQTWRHKWVESVGSVPCSERFFFGYSSYRYRYRNRLRYSSRYRCRYQESIEPEQQSSDSSNAHLPAFFVFALFCFVLFLCTFSQPRW